MIISTQRFRFKDAAAPGDRSAALDAIAALAEAESVEFAFVGRDIGDSADGYTHGLCVGVKDLDALERYFAEPAHAAADRVFLPIVERLTGTGISDDGDVRERVVELHQARLDRDPEYRELLNAIPQAVLIDDER